MAALQGRFPFALNKKRDGVDFYGDYNAMDASRCLLMIGVHSGYCEATAISQEAFATVVTKMGAKQRTFLQRLGLDKLDDPTAVDAHAATRWVGLIALICEMGQLLSDRCLHRRQGEFSASWNYGFS